MSVYWNTAADGTVQLMGDWTKEAISALKPMLAAWEINGEEKYGIWECGKLSATKAFANFSISFGSYDFSTYSSDQTGWFCVADALCSLNDWTREWIKNPPARDGKSINPVTTEQYDLLLKIMHDNSLSIDLKFVESFKPDLGRPISSNNSGTLVSDGDKLIYTDCESEDFRWRDIGKTSLDSAVDFFAVFVEDADESKIRKWVENYIVPSHGFDGIDVEGCDIYEIENLLDSGDYVTSGEDVLTNFIEKFSPDTEVWDAFYAQCREELEWFETEEEHWWNQRSDDELEVDLEEGTIIYRERCATRRVYIKNHEGLRRKYNWGDEYPFGVAHWHDVTAIAVGQNSVTRLKSNGNAITMYNYGLIDCKWNNLKAIAAGWKHIVGLKSDGTVVEAGAGTSDNKLVPRAGHWSDISAIVAGASHTVGLKRDGTVVAVGDNEYGQCDVWDWRSISAIAAGGAMTMGLKGDGTVVLKVPDPEEYDISDWRDIIAIDAGEMYIVALQRDGTVVSTGHMFNVEEGQTEISDWTNIIAIAAGGWHTLGLKADGTVLASGGNHMGQCDVEDWHDITAIAAGHALSFGIKSDGTVVVAGRYFNPNDDDSDDAIKSSH